MKKYAITFLMVFLLAASISAAPGATPGQERGPGPETIVSRSGETMEAANLAEASIHVDSAYEGSGELARESEQQIREDHLNVPPIESFYEGESAESAESVIGADGRVQVTPTTTFPYRAIVDLVIYYGTLGPYGCTGWLFGPNDVMTAGHCVYVDTIGWATDVTVYPGRNGGTAPYGSTTALDVYSVCGWTGGGGSCTREPRKYDYGYIKTADPIGDTVGWFGYDWVWSNTFAGNYTVDGYPTDKPDGTQWKMAGPITHVTTYRLWYKMDTDYGQAGGPVYKGRAACGGPCAFGFQTAGVPLPPFPDDNSATRITQSVFNKMMFWKALP